MKNKNVKIKLTKYLSVKEWYYEKTKNLANFNLFSCFFIKYFLHSNIYVFASTLGETNIPYSGFIKRTLDFQRWSFENPKKIELQLIETIKGDEANQIVKSENMFNKTPDSDEEWILFKFHLKYISGNEELKASDVIYYTNFYTKEGSSIINRGTAKLSGKLKGYGIFDVKLYPCGESDVWVGMLIKKTDGYPIYRISVGYKDYSYLYKWFSTYPTYVEPNIVDVNGIKLNVTEKQG